MTTHPILSNPRSLTSGVSTFQPLARARALQHGGHPANTPASPLSREPSRAEGGGGGGRRRSDSGQGSRLSTADKTSDPSRPPPPPPRAPSGFTFYVNRAREARPWFFPKSGSPRIPSGIRQRIIEDSPGCVVGSMRSERADLCSKIYPKLEGRSSFFFYKYMLDVQCRMTDRISFTIGRVH